MLNAIIRFSVFVTSAIILQGCAPTYNVEIDSISTTESIGKSKYVLLPTEANSAANNLQFCEFSYYTDRALCMAGFQKTDSIDNADFVVVLDYNMSDPLTYQYTYSVPIYGQTGVSSSATNANLNVYGNCANYTSTTNYTPSYGVIGSTTHVGTGVVYYYYLLLGAWDAKQYMRNNKDVLLWSAKIRASSDQGDLRMMFPIMLGASQPYIGKNSGKVVKVQIAEDDQKVKRVKGVQEKSIVDVLMMK